jgi:hypothetical protein
VVAPILAAVGAIAAGAAVAATVGIGPLTASVQAALAAVPTWIHTGNLIQLLQGPVHFGGGGNITIP